MPIINYLDGFIYHMVHIENLRSIFRHKAFFSHLNIRQKDISYRSIAFERVQSLRDRIYVWDHIKQDTENYIVTFRCTLLHVLQCYMYNI